MFSSSNTETSASLSDLSSLYASSGPTVPTTTTPTTTNTIRHAPVKKVDSWGGLVDLNGISAQQQQAPMAPSTNIAMNAFNNYNMSRVPTNYMSPSQPSNGMMMGGGRGYTQSPGMLPPRSMQFQNTTPTQNPRAMSQHRKQAAQTSAASAFEADPFARFN